MRQPGCDRDEYPSAASVVRGESTDAVTWNVACNEPWVDDVRAARPLLRWGSHVGVASSTGSFLIWVRHRRYHSLQSF